MAGQGSMTHVGFLSGILFQNINSTTPHTTMLHSVNMGRYLSRYQVLQRPLSTQISMSEASEALQHVTEEQKENAIKEQPTVKKPKLDREKVIAVQMQIISHD